MGAQSEGPRSVLCPLDPDPEERVVDLNFVTARRRVVEDLPILKAAVGAQLKRARAQAAQGHRRAHARRRLELLALLNLVEILEARFNVPMVFAFGVGNELIKISELHTCIDSAGVAELEGGERMPHISRFGIVGGKFRPQTSTVHGGAGKDAVL